MGASEKVMKTISCREMMGKIGMLNSWLAVCLWLQSISVFLTSFPPIHVRHRWRYLDLERINIFVGEALVAGHNMSERLLDRLNPPPAIALCWLEGRNMQAGV